MYPSVGPIPRKLSQLMYPNVLSVSSCSGLSSLCPPGSKSAGGGAAAPDSAMEKASVQR